MRKRTSSSGPQGPGSGWGRSGASGAPGWGWGWGWGSGWGWGCTCSGAPWPPLSRAPMVCKERPSGVGQPHATQPPRPAPARPCPHLAPPEPRVSRIPAPASGLRKQRSDAGRGWRRDLTARRPRPPPARRSAAPHPGGGPGRPDSTHQPPANAAPTSRGPPRTQPGDTQDSSRRFPHPLELLREVARTLSGAAGSQVSDLCPPRSKETKLPCNQVPQTPYRSSYLPRGQLEQILIP